MAEPVLHGDCHSRGAEVGIADALGVGIDQGAVGLVIGERGIVVRIVQEIEDFSSRRVELEASRKRFRFFSFKG